MHLRIARSHCCSGTYRTYTSHIHTANRQFHGELAPQLNSRHAKIDSIHVTRLSFLDLQQLRMARCHCRSGTYRTNTSHVHTGSGQITPSNQLSLFLEPPAKPESINEKKIDPKAASKNCPGENSEEGIKQRPVRVVQCADPRWSKVVLKYPDPEKVSLRKEKGGTGCEGYKYLRAQGAWAQPRCLDQPKQINNTPA